MKVVIGLGNPGHTYVQTRHNLGFLFVDKLQQRWGGGPFALEQRFNAEISESNAGQEKVLLVKPQTFMNLSGTTVRKIVDYYKLSPADVVVLHDDVDIPIGTYRIATDSSSAGHNGVQSIIDQLGTQTFTRIRIGIGERTEGDVPVCRLGVHDFVLGKFSVAEAERIATAEEAILTATEKLLTA